uniref:C-type lectin domain-containing protein n=1 Tax=Dicentrarchus labrax TaxID=13489 RepID=A0A8C4DSA1_DICLA
GGHFRRCGDTHKLSVSTFFFQGGDEGLTFYQEAKSWIDALEYCQDERENSSLVHITNQTVQNAVKSLLAHKNDSMKNGAWIGLERSIFGKAPPWMWTSGPQVQESCKQWSSNFPVDCLNNHCGKIIWVTINGSEELKWQDACCHEQLPFICQGKLLFNLRPNLP